MNRALAWTGAGLVVALVGCSGERADDAVGSAAQPLEAVCVDLGQEAPEIPEDAWICGEDRVVECGTHAGAEVDYIHVLAPPPEGEVGAACPESPLEVSDEGPFAPGEHVIVVSRPAEGEGGEAAPACASRLIVVDTQPPVASGRALTLWPPNHTLHDIAPADCVDVRDACDGDVRVVFTWAASDEPENGRGDGNHAPDIVDLGCDGVRLRAERSGAADGRVYTLGWLAEDDAGNRTEGTCTVAVTHDRSGRAAIAGEDAYRIELPAGACSERTAPPTDPEAGGPLPGDGEPAPVE